MTEDKRPRAENKPQLEEMNSLVAKNDALIADKLLKNSLDKMELGLIILVGLFAIFHLAAI